MHYFIKCINFEPVTSTCEAITVVRFDGHNNNYVVTDNKIEFGITADGYIAWTMFDASNKFLGTFTIAGSESYSEVAADGILYWYLQPMAIVSSSFNLAIQQQIQHTNSKLQHLLGELSELQAADKCYKELAERVAHYNKVFIQKNNLLVAKLQEMRDGLAFFAAGHFTSTPPIVKINQQIHMMLQTLDRIHMEQWQNVTLLGQNLDTVIQEFNTTRLQLVYKQLNFTKSLLKIPRYVRTFTSDGATQTETPCLVNRKVQTDAAQVKEGASQTPHIATKVGVTQTPKSLGVNATTQTPKIHEAIACNASAAIQTESPLTATAEIACQTLESLAPQEITKKSLLAKISVADYNKLSTHIVRRLQKSAAQELRSPTYAKRQEEFKLDKQHISLALQELTACSDDSAVSKGTVKKSKITKVQKKALLNAIWALYNIRENRRIHGVVNNFNSWLDWIVNDRQQVKESKTHMQLAEKIRETVSSVDGAAMYVNVDNIMILRDQALDLFILDATTFIDKPNSKSKYTARYC